MVSQNPPRVFANMIDTKMMTIIGPPLQMIFAIFFAFSVFAQGARPYAPYSSSSSRSLLRSDSFKPAGSLDDISFPTRSQEKRDFEKDFEDARREEFKRVWNQWQSEAWGGEPRKKGKKK